MYYKLLAYAMPALSPAMGRPGEMMAGNVINDNMIIKRELWGRDHKIYENRWLHSDVKDMAYYYVKGLFDEFVLVLKGQRQ